MHCFAHAYNRNSLLDLNQLHVNAPYLIRVLYTGLEEVAAPVPLSALPM